MGEGAPHNQRYHARQERPGVLVGFAFAHLGFAGFDHDGVAAEFGDARRKAKSGARGGFIKEDRHGLRPFQRLRGKSRMLELRGHGKHFGLFSGGEVVVGEEMPHISSHRGKLL